MIISDPSAWKRYFKFCFVRNPFERAVSLYNWHYRKADTRPSFSQMLCLIEAGAAENERINWKSWQLYTRNDEVVVDFVGRQERLSEDLRDVCDRLGLPFDERFLTRAKANPRRPDIRSYYKPGDRERVERLFGPEIEHFKHRFPDLRIRFSPKSGKGSGPSISRHLEPEPLRTLPRIALTAGTLRPDSVARGSGALATEGTPRKAPLRTIGS